MPAGGEELAPIIQRGAFRSEHDLIFFSKAKLAGFRGGVEGGTFCYNLPFYHMGGVACF